MPRLSRLRPLFLGDDRRRFWDTEALDLRHARLQRRGGLMELLSTPLSDKPWKQEDEMDIKGDIEHARAQ